MFKINYDDWLQLHIYLYLFILFYIYICLYLNKLFWLSDRWEDQYYYHVTDKNEAREAQSQQSAPSGFIKLLK